MARLSIIAFGSRGDIEPYLALGIGLRNAGAHVRFASSPFYEPLVRSWGLEFVAIGTRSALPPSTTATGRAWRSGNRKTTTFVRSLSSTAAPSAAERLADCHRACLDADAIVAGPLALMPAYSVAEKLAVPLIRASYSPSTPTGAFPTLMTPWFPSVSRRLNAWTHRAATALILRHFRAQADQARREVFGLGPLPSSPLDELNRKGYPVLYAFSQAALPRPADWDDSVHVTGYWFLPRRSEWRPPAELTDFIGAGTPPVYIGFGSMADENPAEVTVMALEALRRARRRGVVARGWGGLRGAESSDDVFVLDDVPHDWLFPQMSAVVHHAGAGTTGAGLKAGVPTVPIPFGLPDQTFWGNRVFQVGAGVRPIPRGRLTVDRLASAIRTAADSAAIRDRAKAVGTSICTEAGVDQAVRIIGAYLRQRGIRMG